MLWTALSGDEEEQVRDSQKALALSFRFPASASKAQTFKLPVTLFVKLWSNHVVQVVSQAWTQR
jgi:hypothetical protein